MLAASILSPQFIAGVIIVIVILMYHWFMYPHCATGTLLLSYERLGGYLTTWSVGVHIKSFVITLQERYFKGTGCRFCTSAGYYEG